MNLGKEVQLIDYPQVWLGDGRMDSFRHYGSQYHSLADYNSFLLSIGKFFRHQTTWIRHSKEIPKDINWFLSIMLVDLSD